MVRATSCGGSPLHGVPPNWRVGRSGQEFHFTASNQRTTVLHQIIGLLAFDVQFVNDGRRGTRATAPRDRQPRPAQLKLTKSSRGERLPSFILA